MLGGGGVFCSKKQSRPKSGFTRASLLVPRLPYFLCAVLAFALQSRAYNTLDENEASRLELGLGNAAPRKRWGCEHALVMPRWVAVMFTSESGGLGRRNTRTAAWHDAVLLKSICQWKACNLSVIWLPRSIDRARACTPRASERNRRVSKNLSNLPPILGGGCIQTAPPSYMLGK